MPNVVAFKDATGDAAGRRRARSPTLGDGFELYSGDDALTLPLLAVGAVGVVGVATHWATPEFRELFAASRRATSSAPATSTPGWRRRFAYENSDTCVFAQAAKAALRVLGLPAGECRLPVGPAPDGTEDRAREVLRGARPRRLP